MLVVPGPGAFSEDVTSGFQKISLSHGQEVGSVDNGRKEMELSFVGMARTALEYPSEYISFVLQAWEGSCGLE